MLARTRRDHACRNAACASTITRTVWDGDQLLYEIRAPGGNVTVGQLEDDDATGPFYGRVAYTHGPGIDEPLEIVRMGFPLAVSSTYGLGTWNGPYPVIPYADWHGSMEGATTPTGMEIPCNTTPNLCTPGIWPASNLGAFFEPSAPADHQAWFGSLTTGKTDASGFMYMRNRYYNPQTGTFTQPDPIGIAGGLNVYGFAAGDPVSYNDPYGLDPQCILVPLPDPVACAAVVTDAVFTGMRRIGSAVLHGLAELTPLPSAWRAGQAAGEGRYGAAAGHGALAILGVIPGGAAEADALRLWSKGTFESEAASAAYHLAEHGRAGESLVDYTTDARRFFLRNRQYARPHRLQNGDYGLKITTVSGEGGIYTRGGKIVSYWRD